MRISAKYGTVEFRQALVLEGIRLEVKGVFVHVSDRKNNHHVKEEWDLQLFSLENF